MDWLLVEHVWCLLNDVETSTRRLMMFGFGSHSPVAEHEARDEIEQVYHEIRQTLRVTGVNLVFRKWAAQPGLLPVLWDAVRANAGTKIFEDAADQLRIEAAKSAAALGFLRASPEVGLGESQSYQVRSALDLYHYINPKLLLLVAAVGRGLDEQTGAPVAPPATGVEQIERGFPMEMYAMEMEDSQPDDKQLQAIFGDIQQTLSLESINSDYRTLALWPNYLAAVWAKLKPVVQRPEHELAAGSLRELARTLAASLPYPVLLGRDRIEEAGADFDKAAESAATFERLLPGLILNVALCLQDWRAGDALAVSPFPAKVVGHGHNHF